MYTGGFWNLLSPFALLGGLVSLIGFTLHGAVFLSLKTEGELLKKAQETAWKLWTPTLIILAAFVVAMYFFTDILNQLGINPGPVPFGALLAMLGAGYFIFTRRSGWAFLMTSLSIVFAGATIFLILFPRVMVSSTDPTYSLTIYNAASSAYTLRVMTIIALVFVPVVLLYQGWSYWIFRKRISEKAELHY